MPKIQDVGVGKYIRSPRGRHHKDSRGLAIEVWQIYADNGNSFLCYPVKDANVTPVKVDTNRYEFLPIDTMVEQVTI